MVIAFPAGIIKSIAGKFASVCQDIISSAKKRFYTGKGARILYNLHLLGKVIIFAVTQKCEVQISLVVKYRPPAGKPSGKVSALFL